VEAGEDGVAATLDSGGGGGHHGHASDRGEVLTIELGLRMMAQLGLKHD